MRHVTDLVKEANVVPVIGIMPFGSPERAIRVSVNRVRLGFVDKG